jgi:class 3 adenylate cyclase/predicted ATPase
MDVSTWLRELGLEDYAQAFQANDIDAEVLPRLTADDLIALGITSIGNRRKLLDAIAALDRGRAAASSELIAAATRPLEAERRQLTVLFCDLVGSTELAARLDPEDLREVMRAYQVACANVVCGFEGHVARFLGDGVLAYFGWPRAHEDDPERAVRAGLQLVQDVARLKPRAGVRLQARAGVATGHVVVGDLSSEGISDKDAVSGDAPNLAARLQAIAAPGSVVISQATRRLVGGLFELTDLGPQRLKGFAEPLSAWQVEGQVRAAGRFEARQTMGLTPLVGREEEIALLLRRWEQARDGEGQVVLLSGEPGIGKSRIVRELLARLGGEPRVHLLYQCSPYHTNSAFHPIVAQLERAAGVAPGDDREVTLAKLEGLLGQAVERPDEAVPLLAALLGLPMGGRYPTLNLSPERQKERTLEVLTDQLAGLAHDRPVLELYEDVHWVDPSTRELLDLLVARVRALPVLVVLTYRPEFSPPWSGQAHITYLPLSRLGRQHGAAMVGRVTGGKALPADVLEQIVARTDGVPLFVEELTKTVLESGLLTDAGDRYEIAAPLPALAIPATLHDSLMARLDRLGPVKELAQTAAVIGREFSHALVAAVADRPEQELQTALDRLVSSELVFRRGVSHEATYSFKHALVQDAAYQSLLKSRRRQLHARIARVLEERFPEAAEMEPELLAHHCTEAGFTQQAVDYWHKAGQVAIARSAHAEAIAHLTRGLDLLTRLLDGADHRRRELDLQLALGRALIAAKGYGAAETGRSYARVRELCEQLGDAQLLFPALYGQHTVAFGRGKLEVARELAEEFLRLARCRDDIVVRAMGHRLVGITSLRLGQLIAARAHLEQALTLDDPAGCCPLTLFHYPYDPRIVDLTALASTLLLLGCPDQALSCGRRALVEAQDVGHPESLAYAMSSAAGLAQDLRDVEAARKWAEKVIALATGQGLPHFLAEGTVLRAWALAERGELEEAMAGMRQGLAAMRTGGTGFGIPCHLWSLATVYGKAGHTAQGLELIGEALHLVRSTGESWNEAELHRVKGELLFSASDRDEAVAEAEACFRRAIDVARTQEAKFWELRAATSLARLWTQQGGRAEAHDLLAPLYGWFTEGFDATDLKDAKALIHELRVTGPDLATNARSGAGRA